MIDVAVVGCGAKKAETPTCASRMYTSGFFSLKREYAEAVCDDWYILSAEHGILEPDDVIEPYDTKITDLTKAEREARQVTMHSEAVVHVLFGQLYWDMIDIQAITCEPLADCTSMGEQMTEMRRIIDATRN